jgi:hypothetical protein
MIYTALAYEAQKAVIDERLRRASRLDATPVAHRSRSRRARRAAAAIVFVLAAWVLIASPSALAASVVPDHIVVSLSHNPPDVGQTVTVNAVAKDANGVTLTAFSGAASWSDKSGALAPEGPADFVKGVSRTSAQLATPYRGEVISITAAGITGQTRSFNVIGPADHLELSAPSSPSAGAPFTVTALARDAAGNLVTGFAGPASWSDTAGRITPGAPSDFVAGISTTSATVPSPVHADILTLSSGGLSAKRTINAVGPLDHITASVPSTTSLNTPFDLTVYARDAAGNVVNYTGDLGLSYEDTAAITAGVVNPFSRGVSKTAITVVHPERADSVKLTLGAAGASSNQFNVIGPIDHLAISWRRTDGLTGCDSITGSITARTLDAAGNLVSGFNDASGTWGPNGQDAFPSEPTATVAPFSPAPFVKGVSSNHAVSVSGWTWLSTLGFGTPNDFTVAVETLRADFTIC